MTFGYHAAACIPLHCLPLPSSAAHSNKHPCFTYTCRALEDKAREFNIGDLPSFYSSRLFSEAGFKLDRDAGRLVLQDA